MNNYLKEYLDNYYKLYHSEGVMKYKPKEKKVVTEVKTALGKKKLSYPKAQAGYTLVEAIVIITITATIATVGIAIQRDEIAYAKDKAEYVVAQSEVNNQKLREVYEILKD